jgi:hypothetical protein
MSGTNKENRAEEPNGSYNDMMTLKLDARLDYRPKEETREQGDPSQNGSLDGRLGHVTNGAGESSKHPIQVLLFTRDPR